MKKIYTVSAMMLATCFLLCGFAFTALAQPNIISVSPITANAGATVTINGLGFGATAADNVVYFGSVKAQIIGATATDITVRVPDGAQYSHISVLNTTNALSGAYKQLFLPGYNNACYQSPSVTSRLKTRVDINVPSPFSTVPGSRHGTVGDVDGDGKPDLIISTYDTGTPPLGLGAIDIYLNTSTNGALSYSTTPYICTASSGGVNVKLADLDGDGKLDIIVAASGSGRISCLRNTSTGTGMGGLSFSAKQDLNPGFGGVPEVAIFDFNGDGKLDIASINSDSSRVQVFENQMTSIPSGAFPVGFFGGGVGGVYTSFPVGTVGGAPGSIAGADFDADGRFDIVTSNTLEGKIYVLRNTSVGGILNFSSAVGSSIVGIPTEVQVADINGDNLPDIIAGNYSGGNGLIVLRNSSVSPTLTFTPTLIPTQGTVYALTSGDFDGDGKVDIVVSKPDATDSIKIIRNTHTGVGGAITAASLTAGKSYHTGTGAGNQGITVADFDLDGKPDVFVANYANSTFSIFESAATPDTLSIVASSDSVCVGSTLTVSNPRCAGSTGMWSIAGSHATIAVGATDSVATVTGVSAGVDTVIYKVIYLSDTNYVRYVITVKALADTGMISGTSPLCALSTTLFTETITGGVWSSTNTSVATVDTAGVVTAVAAGSSVIQYTNTSFSCGTQSASYAITVNPRPNAGIITASATPAGTCVGSTISLTSSGAGTAAGWVNMNPAVGTLSGATASNVTLTGNAIGSDTILYTVTNSFSCSDTAMKVLGVVAPSPSSPSLPITGSTAVCANGSQILSNGLTGGTWTTGNAAIATVNATTGEVFAAAASGTTNISYSVNYGCGAADTFVAITITPLPDPGVITGPNAVYFGSTITLTTTGTSGIWISGNTSVATISGTGATVTVNTAGLGTSIISYTKTSLCGSVSDTQSVTVSTLPVYTVPTISSVLPVDGIPLVTTVTINGGGFDNTPANNAVYFGATKATVISASTSSLTVTLPIGATYASISYLNMVSLLACNQQGLFLPTYSRSCYIPATATFKPRIDIPITNTHIMSPSASGPRHAAFGDVDGDGKADLIVSCYNSDTSSHGLGVVNIFRNTSVGGTISYAAPVLVDVANGGTNVKVADLDGDGKLDVIVACSGSGRVSCIRNTSTGPGVISFGNHRELYPNDGAPEAAIADYDGDGKLDVAVITYNASLFNSQVKIFRNQMTSIPTGGFPAGFFGADRSYDSFAIVINSLSGSLYSADFDGDGRIDIVTSNTSDNSISVLHNTSSIGTFAFDNHVEFSTGGSLPTEVQVAEITGDNKPEVVVLNFGSSNVTVFENTSTSGSINFTPVNYATSDSSYGMGTGDIDGDGKVDVVITRSGPDSIYILRNNHGGGSLTGTSFIYGANYSAGAGSEPQGLSVGDIDGDKKPDVVISNFLGGNVSVFRNTSTPTVNAITGSDSVCLHATIALTSPHCDSARGYWSATTGRVSVVAGATDTTGLVTGLTVGADTIVYTVVYLSDTNTVRFAVDVKPLADTGAITGLSTVCVNGTLTLSNVATGGVWASSVPSVATVDATTGVVYGVAAGSTIISYTAQSFSCGPLSATHPVTVNPLPDAGTITASAPGTCVGQSITLTASVTGGAWFNVYPAIATITGSTTTLETVTGVSAGTDTVLYVFTNACGSDTVSQSVGVVPFAATTSPITGTTTACLGDTVQLSNAATGGTWSTSNASIASVNATTGTVYSLSAGTATIFYTATYPCATINASTPFTVNAIPNAGVVAGADSICVGETITLTTTGAAGTWHSRFSFVSVISGTGAVTGVAPGTDTVVYLVSTASCGSDSTTHVVTVKTTPNAGTITGGASVCVGSSITLVASGDAGGVWSSSSPTNATVTTAGVVGGAAAGTSTISYIVNSFSCASDTATQLVTINALPDAGTIAGADSICVNETVTLNTTGTGGTWHNRFAFVSIVSGTGAATGLVPGTDTAVYLVTSASCGSDSATHAITVKRLPDAGAISGGTSVCVGSSLTLVASGDAGGVWSSSSPTNATVTTTGVVGGAAAGTSTISYIVNSFSCASDTATQLVTINALPDAGVISSTSDSVCIGNTVVLTTTGATGGTWHSRFGFTTVTGAGVVTGVSAGTDSLVYVSTTTSCGTDSAAYAITVNTLPDAGLITGADSVCAGATIALANAVTTGVWSSSVPTVATVSTTGVVSGSVPGSTMIVYTVTTFSCGSDTVSHMVTVNALPNAGNITGASSVCAGFTTPLANTVSGGTWSVVNANATVSATGIVTGVTPGSDTVIYTVTNSCGTATDSFTILVTPLPDAGVVTGANDSMCIGSTMTLSSTVTGGIWVSTNTVVATVDTAGVVTSLSAGTDSILYVYTNTCGSDTTIYPLTIIATPFAGVITGPSFVCMGTTITLTDTTTGGVWSSSNTAIATIDATGQVFPVDTGVVVIHYTFTNFCGTADTSDTIRVNPQPFAGIITGVTSLCPNSVDTLTDTTSGGIWSSSAPGIVAVSTTGIITSGATAGTAIISYAVTNVCGTAYAFDTVVVYPIPTLTSALNGTVCSGTAFTYTPSATPAGSSYSWARAIVPQITNAAASDTGGINEILISTSAANVNVAYVYTISASGCSNVQTLNVTVKPTPTLTSDTTLTVCSGSPILYLASSATTGTVFAWTRALVAGISPLVGSGTYVINETLTSTSLTAVIPVTYVFVLTANGCSSTQNVRANVEPAPPTPPQITTMSPSYLCTGTMYQNFGAASVADTGVTYTWSSYGAQVWATGNTDQYCLVNFTAPGMTWVYLTASLTGFTCTSRDSFAVIVNNSVSDNPEVWYFNSDFVCTPSDESTYQWGYDDALTLDSTLLSGETNQNYYNPTPDLLGKYYWVITTRHGCYQKTYYKTPTGIANATAGGVKDVNIYPNPNDGTFNVNVSSDFTEKGTITITNVVGETVMEVPCTTNKRIEMKLDKPAGMYLITVNTPHGKFTGKVTITGK